MKYFSGDKIEKNEMGRACSTYGNRCDFWWENLRERDHWRYPGVDGKIILRLIFRMWDMDWIKLVQDRDRWRALVNAAMNLRIP
jgi:hypothetical protein